MDLPQTLIINHQMYTAEQMRRPQSLYLGLGLGAHAQSGSGATLDKVSQGRSWLQQHFTKLYGPESFEVQLADFLAEWFAPGELLTVQTSGSTGTPKQMQVSKLKMLNSARLTVEFLGLKSGDTAYLCMPLQYIAGKMMVVRALLAGLDLLVAAPSGRPVQALLQSQMQLLASSEAKPESSNLRLEFSAMIPMQVYNTLQSHDLQEIEVLKGIKQLIIGGGAVDENLGQELKSFPHAVWSTYGMTETLSHIALRRLNGPLASEWYTPFAHVTLSQSTEQTLVIDAPLVTSERLVTNDIVEFNAQGQFRILGRKDNTINTGGVKVQIEQVENALKPHLPWPFMITFCPDAKFGQIVVLLVAISKAQILGDKQAQTQVQAQPKSQLQHQSQESQAAVAVQAVLAASTAKLALEQLSNVMQAAYAKLPAFWRPKVVGLVTALPQTGSGKPDRANAARLAKQFEQSKLSQSILQTSEAQAWAARALNISDWDEPQVVGQFKLKR